MSNYFRNYENIYPDLVYNILEYFCLNQDGKPIKDRSVLDFCMSHKPMEKDILVYQPDTIVRICQRLCDKNIMNQIRNDGGLGINNNYLFVPRDIDSFTQNKEQLTCFYNSTVYGFEYIYNLYKSLVVPLVWVTSDQDYHVGTGFKYLNGIVTAKHCVTDVDHLRVKGYTAKELNGKNIFVSENDGIDVAFIETNQIANPILYSADGQIMQDVLVMGYPVIPAFTDFLTVEKATISSKAESRLTPTKGAVVAYGNQYLLNMEALLITAKIRGGNSGGPVINENGCVIGVSCQIPDYSNNDNNIYDDLGYGVAVPFKYVTDIIINKRCRIEVKQDFFEDYE